MAQSDPSRWSDHLPLVLLSLRSTLKADIGCTAADLVYGTSLRLPGDYVEQLRSVMRNLRATPPRASPANSFIPPDLDKCNFVLVRHDAVRRPLQPPYDGPYKVHRRSDKDVVIDRNGKSDTVSTDRVKPAFIDDRDHSLPQHCTPPQTLMPPPTGDSPPPVRRTRSGRHVHWPDRFKQMDFEYALWQMVNIFSSPQKLYRNFSYHHSTGNQWARDDPAFLILLLPWIFVSSIAISAIIRHTFFQWFKLLMWSIFVDCIASGMVVCTLLWILSNRWMIRKDPSKWLARRSRRFSAASDDSSEDGSQLVPPDVEWAYAFDIHLNAYFPCIVVLRVLQLPFLFRKCLLFLLNNLALPSFYH
nr:unnamed protein product [Spirometra erinaceieuropaei]